MRILGKNVSFHAHVMQTGDPILLGIAGHREYCEGCGAPRDITEIGIGIAVFAIVIHDH